MTSPGTSEWNCVYERGNGLMINAVTRCSPREVSHAAMEPSHVVGSTGGYIRIVGVQ